MPIDIQYAPVQAIGAAARAVGAGEASRDMMQFGAQQSMRDRHFYDSMRNDRISMYERHALGMQARQYEAGITQQEAAAREAALMQRMERSNQLERDNTDWKYTKEQEQEQQTYQKRLQKVEELERRGDLDPVQARAARFQINEQLMGIKPLPQPKENPFERYHQFESEDGRRYFAVPGRNGAPEWRPADPTELDPKAAAKREADIEKAKLAAEKEAYAREQKQADMDMRREEIAMKRYEMLTKPVPGEDGITSKPRMSHEQALKASGLDKFLPNETAGAATPPAAATPGRKPMIHSNDDAAYDALPPGTEFVDENGAPFRKPK